MTEVMIFKRKEYFRWEMFINILRLKEGRQTGVLLEVNEMKHNGDLGFL